jgi:cysteine desulfurase
MLTFVCGATEALNTVLRGYIGFAGWNRKKVVTCTTEHEAVLAPIQHLQRHTGVAVEVLSVDASGRLDVESVRSAVDRPGVLLAIMQANNEIGTVHPIGRIADVVHAAGGYLLCDTTQAFGKMPVDVRAMGIDVAVMSAHKIYGPKGVGALLRGSDAFPLEPLILGGGQERGLRGGTLNVPGIVGLGEACRILESQLDADIALMTRLRNRLEDTILADVPDTWVNGDRQQRLCNTTNIGFKAVDARTLIRDMHDIAVSTRSACSSGNGGPSHVLKAIGLSDEDAYSCIRFSVGRFTTDEEIDYAISKVVTSVHKLRSLKSVRV